MSEIITIKTRQQQRRGTAAQWTATNPVLLDAELGYEKDTRRFKVGDGVTAWKNLPYAGYVLPAAAASSLGGIIAAAKGSGDTVEVKIDSATRKLYVPGYPSVPKLAPVATSGKYGDLTGKPTIPAAYTLPAATASLLGGIIAVAKGSGDTVEVKIDTATHKLFVPTYPAGGSGGTPIETITNFNTAPINTLFYAEAASGGPTVEGFSTKMLGITIGNPASPTTFVQLAISIYQSSPWGCGPLFMRSSTSSGPDRWTQWACVGQYEPNNLSVFFKSLTSFFGGNNIYRYYLSGVKTQVIGLVSITVKDYSSLTPVGSWRLCGAKGFVRFSSSSSGEEVCLPLPFSEYNYGNSVFRAALRDKNNATYLDITAPNNVSYTVSYTALLEYGSIYKSE